MSKQQRDAIDAALRVEPFGLSQGTAGPGLGGGNRGRGYGIALHVSPFGHREGRSLCGPGGFASSAGARSGGQDGACAQEPGWRPGEPATGDSVLGQACGWRFTLRAAAMAWATPSGSEMRKAT